jgi:predicted RNA methylase
MALLRSVACSAPWRGLLASGAREVRRWVERLGRLSRRFVSRVHYLSGEVIDRRYGVETSRQVQLTELGLAHEDRVGYQPSDWLILRRILRRIGVGPQDVFLDLGSGKARLVLEAARHPFKRVIGVEISPQLSMIAAANIEASRSRLRCQDIELIESDIAEFRVPDDVTVVYAFNPFGGATFEAAMRALIASFDRRPRRICLIYPTPREHDRLIESGRFRLATTVRRWRPSSDWMRRAAIPIYEIHAATPVHRPAE